MLHHSKLGWEILTRYSFAVRKNLTHVILLPKTTTKKHRETKKNSHFQWTSYQNREMVKKWWGLLVLTKSHLLRAFGFTSALVSEAVQRGKGHGSMGRTWRTPVFLMYKMIRWVVSGQKIIFQWPHILYYKRFVRLGRFTRYLSYSHEKLEAIDEIQVSPSFC